MSVMGPMRTLDLRQSFPNPLNVSAVGTQLTAQDSRTTARCLGGVLRESQPLASVPAPTREAIAPARTNDLPHMRKVCLGEGRRVAALPRRRRCYGVTVVAKTSVRLEGLPEFAWTKNDLNVVPLVSSAS